MGIFGWSYPPGCSGTPFDEEGASDITKYVTEMKAPISGVYWTEYGELVESFPVNVPADEEAGIPAYVEGGEQGVGKHEWNDELTDEENFKAAAAAYDRIKRGEAA